MAHIVASMQLCGFVVVGIVIGAIVLVWCCCVMAARADEHLEG